MKRILALTLALASAGAAAQVVVPTRPFTLLLQLLVEVFKVPDGEAPPAPATVLLVSQ